MCVRYVNATISLYGTILANNAEITGFLNPMCSFIAKEEADKFSLGNFSIVTQISLLGSRDGISSLLNQRKTISVFLVLSKTTDGDNKELDRFDIDLEKEQILNYSRIEYYNMCRISNFTDFKISRYKGKGEYVINVLIKEKDSNESPSVQAMFPITIE